VTWDNSVVKVEIGTGAERLSPPRRCDSLSVRAAVSSRAVARMSVSGGPWGMRCKANCGEPVGPEVVTLRKTPLITPAEAQSIVTPHQFELRLPDDHHCVRRDLKPFGPCGVRVQRGYARPTTVLLSPGLPW
jgi:hypothetical protein